MIFPETISRMGRTRLKNETRKMIKLIDDISKTYSMHFLFDVVNNKGKSVSLTEYCSALDGAYIRVLNNELHAQMLEECIKEQLCTVDYSNFLINKTDLNKYKLRKTYNFYQSVVFLPGSNIIEDVVDFDLVDDAVFTNSAVIKPHPITGPSCINRLKERYGSDKVLHPKENGFDLLMNCENMYVTASTEFAMYGSLLQKNVVGVDSDRFLSTAYRLIYDIFMKYGFTKDVANYLLNNYKSGIFLTSDRVDDIHKHMKYIEVSYANRNESDTRRD